LIESTVRYLVGFNAVGGHMGLFGFLKKLAEMGLGQACQHDHSRDACRRNRFIHVWRFAGWRL